MQIPADSKEEQVEQTGTTDVPEPLPEGGEAALSPVEIRHLLRVSGSQRNVLEGTSSQVQEALQHGHKLWDSILDHSLDHNHFDQAPTFSPDLANVKAVTQPKKKAKKHDPGSKRNDIGCIKAYPETLDDIVREWRTELLQAKVQPDEEQMGVLEAVLERCKLEATAEATDTIHKCPGDPMLAIVHGLPGAGKSEVIKWLRKLFEKLGWTDNAEFMCAAPMNSMAALIGGRTVHNIGGLGYRSAPRWSAGWQTGYDADTA